MTGTPGTGPTAADAFGTPEAPRTTSKAGYWLAAGLVLLAFLAGGLWAWQGFSGLDEAVDDLHRLDIPGRGTFALEEGEQSVYYEGSGSGNIRMSITAPDGTPVTVRPHGGTVSYSVGGHSGESVFGYTIAEPGDHRVEVRGLTGGQVAFGEGVGGRIVGIVVGGLVIFFVFAVSALVVFLVTRRRRRRSPS